MSFGCFKNGVNSTDKRLIKRFTAAGWPVDKISAKLSVRPAIIEKFIARQADPVAATAAEPVAEVEAPVVETPVPAAPKKKAKAKAK